MRKWMCHIDLPILIPPHRPFVPCSSSASVRQLTTVLLHSDSFVNDTHLGSLGGQLELA